MDEHAERERLRAEYAAMPDDQLLELAGDREQLTDEGWSALNAELGRRNLIVQPGEARRSQFEARPLVTIAHFMDLMSAQLAMTMLDSAGISSFLKNENMVRLGWSVAAGGIDVQVDAENVAVATELLEQPPIHIVPDTEDAQS
jgi:hypothetical protein